MELKKLLRTKTAIHCDTEEKAVKLIAELKKLNYNWNPSLADNNQWGSHRADTCYYLDSKYLSYSHTTYADTNNYRLIKFDNLRLVEFSNPIEKRLEEINEKLTRYKPILDEAQELLKEKVALTKKTKQKDYAEYVKLKQKYEGSE